MIMLFVILLTIGNEDAKGWTAMSGPGKVFSYESIAECQAKRKAVILHVHKSATYALISACAAAQDTVEYNVYGNDTKSVPVPAITPGRNSS